MERGDVRQRLHLRLVLGHIVACCRARAGGVCANLADELMRRRRENRARRRAKPDRVVVRRATEARALNAHELPYVSTAGRAEACDRWEYRDGRLRRTVERDGTMRMLDIMPQSVERHAQLVLPGRRGGERELDTPRLLC